MHICFSDDCHGLQLRRIIAGLELGDTQLPINVQSIWPDNLPYAVHSSCLTKNR